MCEGKSILGEGERGDVQFLAGAGEGLPGHRENGENHQVPEEADDEEEEDKGEGQLEDGGAGGHESSSFRGEEPLIPDVGGQVVEQQVGVKHPHGRNNEEDIDQVPSGKVGHGAVPKDTSHHVHQQKEEEQAQDEEGTPAVAGVDARKADLFGWGWVRRRGREGGREGRREGVCHLRDRKDTADSKGTRREREGGSPGRTNKLTWKPSVTTMMNRSKKESNAEPHRFAAGVILSLSPAAFPPSPAASSSSIVPHHTDDQTLPPRPVEGRRLEGGREASSEVVGEEREEGGGALHWSKRRVMVLTERRVRA